ncbi:MAG: hypothetical protein A2749_01280 [Parcubacteria group bacterium RIFCSPHIGHO2_01_FULL_45_26]|nr:MAG: hypothetical protein A2749_01280 [Parcubacteria group bacterium RIFCSPHIGHO2_01_FULL_45_26]
MPFQKDNIHRNFSSVVKAYEKARHQYPNEIIEWCKSVIKIDHPLVLDVDCGTGISTRQLADTGFEVVGPDPSREMIAKAAEVKNPLCKYVVASAELIPFPNHTTSKWYNQYR